MTIIHADCIEAMAAMEPDSVDAIVTDPPYGLEFMGMAWDQFDGRENGTPRPRNEWGDFGSREHARGQDDAHRVALKKARALQSFSSAWAEAAYRVAKPSAYLLAFGGTRTVHRMTVALEDAGWIIRDMLVWAYASGFPKSKASLKPAWEPIVMARKPGPLRMLAIDECRIPLTGDENMDAVQVSSTSTFSANAKDWTTPTYKASGRWPANVILTDPIFDGGVEGVVGGGESASGGNINGRPVTGYSKGWADERWFDGYSDTGTYSRYFLLPKASRSDREPVLTPDWFEGTGRVSTHPTVKPTDLMRHLVRLVTPTGGTVLDPFGGSGTTAIAAEREGFDWILIEREAEYVAIAEARLNGTQRGLGLESA